MTLLVGALAVACLLVAGFARPATARAEGTVTITSPEGGSLVASPVAFSGGVEGTLPELIGELQLHVYPASCKCGTPQTEEGTIFGGSWSTTVSLGPGAHTAVAEFKNTVEDIESSPDTVEVEGAPTVTHEPSDVTVAEGEPAQFTAEASGTPEPEVSWEVSTDNGVEWAQDSSDSGGHTDTLTIGSVSAGQDGNLYRASFHNVAGTARTEPVSLHVETAPSVTLDPKDETVGAGADAEFSAEASGSPSPSIQWEFSSNGGSSWSDFTGSGEHSTTMRISGVNGSENGWRFRARFSNSVGTVRSGEATLTVVEGPQITLSPSDETVVAGEPATFTTAATGTPAPGVHWEVSANGGSTWSPAPPPNESDTLTFTATAAENGNLYRAVFENSQGSATTSAARLTVEVAPEVTNSPQSITVAAGSPAEFTAHASGSPTPAVQWQVSTNGGGSWSAIGGANSTTYTIGSATVGQSGNEYRAVFKNAAGEVPSEAAVLTVHEAPHITHAPSNETVVAGSPASFTASATGTPRPSVRWEVSSDEGVNWSPAPPPNESETLTFTATAGENGHRYRAVFENDQGSVATPPAQLTVEVPPVITGNPSSVTLPAGERAEFRATATGSPTPGVQWQLSTNGGVSWSSISGATSTTYLTAAVTVAENGWQYRAMFSNAAGEAPTSAAVLTVHEGPHVKTQPAAATAIAGSPAHFTAEAEGTPTPTVQWEVSSDNGITWAPDTGDPGSTTDTLTIASASASQNEFLYRATFTNLLGSVVTKAAKLDVETKPSVSVAPAKLVTAPGLKAHFTAAVSSNPSASLKWQYEQAGATSWTTIAGATSTEYSLEAKPSYNGLKVRAVATNLVGTTESDPSEIEVTERPAVQVQPESHAVPAGSPVEFEAVASGNPMPVEPEWQVSTNGGASWTKYSAAVPTEHRFPPEEVATVLKIGRPTAAESGEELRAVFRNEKGTAATIPAVLTVETAPAITQQPVSSTVPAGYTAYFTASANGVPGPSVQWQESSDGSSWSNIPGARSTTLTLPGVSLTQSGRLYRGVFENGIGKAATTEAALLTVSSAAHAPPSAAFSWAPAAPRAGESVSLVATASDASSPISAYAWDVQGKGLFASGPAAISTIFATAGAHTVSLRVSAADGQSVTVTKTIEVGAHRYPLMSPFPIVRLDGYFNASGARITLLSVQAPVGARIMITCRGRRCPIRKQVQTARARPHRRGLLTVVVRRFERSFPAGAVLQIRVSFPGAIGKYTSFKIRRGHMPLRADACLDPVRASAIECPS